MTRKDKIFLVCLFIIFLAAAYLFSRMEYGENILVMVPEKMQREVALFQATPLAGKIFMVVHTEDAALLPQAAGIAAEHAETISAIRRVPIAGPEFLLSYYYHLPNIWSAELETRALALLDPAAIHKKMQENIMRLMGPEGAIFGEFILADPLGLLGLITPYLEGLNITGGSLAFENGYLVSENGENALLIFNADEDAFDRAGALRLTGKVEEINALLPEGARVFAMGAARYTRENNDIIARDAARGLTISLLLMIIIFLFFFRKRNALFIYVVPVLVLVPSAVFTWLALDTISGITIGFGSVLMGLAIDYSVYIYFAFKASSVNTARSSVGKAMLRPIALSAATSIISFGALYFCGIPFLRQIGLFVVFGLLFAMFIAFTAAPILFQMQGQPEKDFAFAGHVRPRISAAVIALIILLGAGSVPFVRVNTSLDSLNTVSAQFKKDKEIFDGITGGEARNSLLFVFGRDKNDALGKSALLGSLCGARLPLAEILVSSATADQNRERWHDFWTPEQRARIENDIRSASSAYGLKADAFAGFFDFLQTASAPPGAEEFDIAKIYNPFTVFEGRDAIAHVLRDEIQLPAGFENDAILVSQKLVQEDLFYSVLKSLLLITIAVFIIDCILLFANFRSARLVLLAFVPAFCSVAAILFASAVFGVRFNLFSLFSIPLVIGLNLDYAIFIIHQKLLSRDLHPSRAVTAAALLSVAGFGALLFAEHTVMFALGLTINIGIITALLVSVYLLPALIKNSKNIAAVLLVVLFAGCASSGDIVRYNVPAANAPADKTRAYYGELGGQIVITAVFAEVPDGARVVTLHELGFKLADMTVNTNTVSVHSYMRHIPKRAIRSLALFYRNFYFDRGALVQEAAANGGRAYKNNDGRIALWVDHDNI
ncbi:MAG: MMPL family transporter [Spirochaetota bacterium]|jgi:predicted exporter|nr:MMPL family transporter [Spirochaetota bacterium]